jgi:hypothetical protein
VVEWQSIALRLTVLRSIAAPTFMFSTDATHRIIITPILAIRLKTILESMTERFFDGDYNFTVHEIEVVSLSD